VYVTKHRISAAIARDVKRLEKELERKATGLAGAARRTDEEELFPTPHGRTAENNRGVKET